MKSKNMFFNKTDKNNNLLREDDRPSITEWLNHENEETDGQLAVDVYQTADKIVIKSTIAGAKPEDLKISLHNDLLTIRGTRSNDEEAKDEYYLYRECYWGSFSRSIILPAEVDNRRVEAELENGVLTITLYKNNPKQIEIKLKD